MTGFSRDKMKGLHYEHLDTLVTGCISVAI